MVVEELLQGLKVKEGCYRAAGIILNNDVAQQAVAILEQGQQKLSAPVCVLEDQIVPANAPEVSEAQQRMAAFAEQQGFPYLYGQSMASHYAAGLAQAGDLYVSGDKDIAMVGAVGALGVALTAEALVQAMLTSCVQLPTVKVLRVRLEGNLSEGLDIRAAAGYLVEQLKPSVEENTIIEFFAAEALLSLEEKRILCGWTRKLGALSALFATGEGSDIEVDCILKLEKVTSLLKGVPEQPVKAVFIGGAYGGTLEAIKRVAEVLQGQKVAYQVRLSVAPASAEIYVAAAKAGYLATILEAEGMVLNQCALPPVQARLGDGELMVSNDIHGESGYAGEGGIIYLASTEEAVKAAITGRIGGEG